MDLIYVMYNLFGNNFLIARIGLVITMLNLLFADQMIELERLLE